MATEHSENNFFIAAMVLVAALVFFIFLPELNVIVLGISFAVLFQPLYEKLRSVMRDGFAAALMVLLAIVIILLPLTIFGFQIFLEAQGLYARLSSGGTAPLENIFKQVLHNVAPSLNVNLATYVQQALGILISNIGPIFSGVIGVIGALFLSFFAFYYFLKDGTKLRPQIIEGSPLSKERTDQILTKLHEMASSVIRGSLVVSVLYGILVGIGFFLVGLPSAILWGGVTVVASFIPVFGVMLVVVPGIIYLVAIGNIIPAVGLIVWTFAMSIFMENFLRPRLLGRRAKIHPLLMLLAVLGGLSFFGPIGILLGPLALSLLLTLFEIYPSIAQDEKVARKAKKLSEA
jgi:predicted PurR-regulated permease PerM